MTASNFTAKPVKLTRCKICQQLYQKWSISQKTCGPECSLELVRQEKEKKARKEYLAQKVIMRSRRDWLALAQKVFNAYIRARDKDRTCICCNMPLTQNAIGGGYDCGHYRSVGSAPHLRFDPNNAHAQKKQCNRYGSGRAVDYRLGLIKRIGIGAVEKLESDQTPRKYTIPDLQAIIKEYKQKIKEL
jgi:hypothetical protein